MSVTRNRSPEPASTPISKGGWKYHHDDEEDRIDFAEHNAAELEQLAAERDLDFGDHPALASES